MTSYTYELIELGDDAHGLGCKCCRFGSGTDLPMPKKEMSKTEIEGYAREFGTSIFSDWTALNAVVKRFEGTIQKRWLKKSIKQRREILLKACPEMPTCHRPDFAGFRKTLRTAPRSRTCPSRAYLWPYINFEDLQQNNPLLLFLHSRGRHLPENFISSDIDNAHLGRGWDFCAHQKSDAMVFHDQHTPRKYGAVMGLAEGLSVPSHFVGAMRLVSRVHPNLGLLGMEIQAGIYSFLLECAKVILHDVDQHQFYLAAHQPAPPALTVQRGVYASLQDQILEAPYRLPQGLDLDRIKTMASSRRSAAADHLWLLREDPSYFIESLKEWKEHDFRNVKCACGTCWNEVAGDMIIDAFSYFLFWHEINRRFEQMSSIESQLARADVQQVRLPPKEERLWAELDEIVNMMTLMPLDRIMSGLPVAPRLRHCYPRGSDINAPDYRARWTFKARQSNTERRIDLIFHAIIDADQRALHQLGPLIQEAQYMLDTDPEAAQLVDSWLLGQFSDLAIITELSDRMHGFKPWSDGWRVCTTRSKPVVENVGKLLRLDTALMEAIGDAAKKNTTLYDPNGAWWRYPADKRPSKANVDQMRHAEAHLDMFWDELQENVLDYAGEDLFEILNTRGLRKRTMYRTPAWKEPLVAQPPPVQLTGALRELPINTQRCGDSTDSPAAKSTKVKVKTRGLAAPATVNTLAEAPTAPSEDSTGTPEKVVKVSKRAYKVFSALLPHPTAENHQRIEVAWDDLLHAMNSIGMQPEKLYGSVWNFRPSATEHCAVDVSRGIQFHEPKEVRRGNKIGSHMVRTFGRRLKHAYGWEAGLFVCE